MPGRIALKQSAMKIVPYFIDQKLEICLLPSMFYTYKEFSLALKSKHLT